MKIFSENSYILIATIIDFLIKCTILYLYAGTLVCGLSQSFSLFLSDCQWLCYIKKSEIKNYKQIKSIYILLNFTIIIIIINRG